MQYNYTIIKNMNIAQQMANEVCKAKFKNALCAYQDGFQPSRGHITVFMTSQPTRFCMPFMPIRMLHRMYLWHTIACHRRL